MGLLALRPGDVVSYLEMCAPFGVNLQRGMNFRLRDGESLILMSVRPGAPYHDRVEQCGKVIIYEGHDVPKTSNIRDPKNVDQPEVQPNGGLAQNGLFMAAAQRFKEGKQAPERVRVFEKIRNGIWVYNGLFDLVDGWRERAGKRTVFKFKLQLIDEAKAIFESKNGELAEHDRVIPTAVKLEVWKRDKGSCAKCGSKQNLHFDHIIPYSLGGSSKDATNIQILCGKHNIAKRDQIE